MLNYILILIAIVVLGGAGMIAIIVRRLAERRDDKLFEEGVDWVFNANSQHGHTLEEIKEIVYRYSPREGPYAAGLHVGLYQLRAQLKRGRSNEST